MLEEKKVIASENDKEYPTYTIPKMDAMLTL